MRPTTALLLAAAATCFFAVRAGVNLSGAAPRLSPSAGTGGSGPTRAHEGHADMADMARGAVPVHDGSASEMLSADTLNTTSRGSISYNRHYIRGNPKVYVRIFYSVDNHAELFINHGSSSRRSRREHIRRVQRATSHTRTYRWQGWMHVGAVMGFRVVNKDGPGGLIFALYVRVGRRWVKQVTGKYPLPLHTFSPRSRYMGWMNINYRPCRWHKAVGRYVHPLRINEKFPYKTGARYTWPWRKHGRRSIFHVGHVIYRYKLGGECGYRPPGIPRPHPPIRRHYRLVTINCASDNVGYLFINGRRRLIMRNPLGAKYFHGWLRLGTTIGFQTTNTGGPGGMIVSILIRHGRRKYRLNTGTYPFRVHGISRNRRFNHIWKFPVYKTCRWPRATKPFAHNLRISKRFPYSTKAKYIWFPRAYKRRGTMFMRYKLGGERCQPRPRRHYRLVTITFAADNVGYLYINGRRVKVVRSFAKHQRYRKWLRLGTTIGIQARNLHGAGGIIASILVQHGRRKYRLNTGRYPFRVHHYWKSPRHRRLNHIWKFPVYKTCRWPRAGPKWVHKLKISKTFPYRRIKTAKYIWAPGNYKHVGTIFLRYRLGGERCPRTPKPPPKPRGCPCRKSQYPRTGACYVFTGKEPRGSRPGTCRRKDCEKKYECTSRARAKGRCIWKFATDEIKVVGSRGRLTCRRMRLPKRNPFLVPYTS